MLESERSFLVRESPDLSAAARKEIEQHYLTDDAEPLRIRRSGDRFELTRKTSPDPADPTRRHEHNVPITADQFARLKTLAVRSVEKTRYALPLPGGLEAEVDVFGGALKGFIKAEVEFPDEDARRAFTPPPWFGREISGETWALNQNLAGISFEDIKDRL